MDFHKQKRPDVDWSKVNIVDCKMRIPKTDNPSPWLIHSENGCRPLNPDLMKKLNKLIKQYGLDDIEEYIEIKRKKEQESIIAREIWNNAKNEVLKDEFCDPLNGDHIGINSEYFE